MDDGLGILLVDDELDLRDALAQMLEMSGHRVACASDGEEALKAYHQGDPAIDIVISDLSMPGMGGAALVTALRQERRNLPIIVFSGLEETMARRLIASLSGIYYLKKPFTFNTLLEAIEKCQTAPGAGPSQT